MVIDMNETQLNTVAQLRAFLDGTLEVQFQPIGNDAQRYGFIGAVLSRFAYRRLHRAHKGVVLRYLARTTGYSRQQLTRLLRRFLDGTRLAKRYRAPAHGFARKFTAADVKLLAQTDALHGTLSGPATKVLMHRAYHVYGDPRYERLARLNPATRLRGCTGPRPAAMPSPLPSAAPPPPRGAAASSASIRSTRAIRMAPKGSITSTPWTASPSSNSWPPANA